MTVPHDATRREAPNDPAFAGSETRNGKADAFIAKIERPSANDL